MPTRRSPASPSASSNEPPPAAALVVRPSPAGSPSRPRSRCAGAGRAACPRRPLISPGHDVEPPPDRLRLVVRGRGSSRRSRLCARRARPGGGPWRSRTRASRRGRSGSGCARPRARRGRAAPGAARSPGCAGRSRRPTESSPVETDELSTKPPCRFVTAVTCSATRCHLVDGRLELERRSCARSCGLRWPGREPAVGRSGRGGAAAGGAPDRPPARTGSARPGFRRDDRRRGGAASSADASASARPSTSPSTPRVPRPAGEDHDQHDRHGDERGREAG